MEVLGVGPLEVLLIVLLAIVLFVPKDIARTARSAGHTLNRLYHSEGWRTLLRTSETLRTLPNRLAREAELEELDDLRRTIAETERSVADRLRPDTDLQAWTPAARPAPKAPPLPTPPPSPPSNDADSG